MAANILFSCLRYFSSLFYSLFQSLWPSFFPSSLSIIFLPSFLPSFLPLRYLPSFFPLSFPSVTFLPCFLLSFTYAVESKSVPALLPWYKWSLRGKRSLHNRVKHNPYNASASLLSSKTRDRKDTQVINRYFQKVIGIFFFFYIFCNLYRFFVNGQQKVTMIM